MNPFRVVKENIEVYDYIDEEIIVTFSPVGNSILEAIPVLIDLVRQGYDMVIASRYKGCAKSYDDTTLTALGNMVFSKIISLFGYKYHDAMVMFRAYRREIPNILKLNLTRSSLYEKILEFM